MAADATGAIIYQGQSGAANIASTPESRIRRNLLAASNGCPKPNFVCAGFAGLINQSTRERALEILGEIFPGSKIQVEPDFTAAYFACPKGTDICVISGTGSLVCSRQGDEMKKSGGAGYLLGDEGSAFQFGRDALRQFLAEPDAASPALQASIQQQFGTLEPGDIVAQTYRAPGPASLIAKLSKAVVADYREGAEYARRSVDRQTEALAEVTARHYRKWFSQAEVVNVCLAGGAWKGSTEIRAAFEAHLNRLISPTVANVSRIEKPPLHGALTLAFMMDQRN